MNLLLDTHTLVWWLQGDDQLSLGVRGTISSDRNRLFVSPVSAWKMAIKHRAGKWDAAGEMSAELSAWMIRFGFQELPVTISHAAAAGALPGPRKDPFDRLLIVQAMLEDATLVTSDRVFAGYPVPVLWA